MTIRKPAWFAWEELMTAYLCAFTQGELKISGLFPAERQITVSKDDLIKYEHHPDKPSELTAEQKKRLDTMGDQDIDYTDIPELDDDFFAAVERHLPRPKEAISLRIDPDVLAWYRSQGKGYQSIMNAVLKAYAERYESPN